MKGLTQGNDAGGSNKRPRSPAPSKPSSSVPVKRPRPPDPVQPVQVDDDIQEVLPIKTEPTSVMEVDTGVVAMPQEQQEVYEETGEYGYEESGADNSSVGNIQDGNPEGELDLTAPVQ